MTTDRAPAYPRIVEDMLPGALHVTVKYANNRIEADHGRLEAGSDHARDQDGPIAAIVATGAFIQNLRRGHYELATDATTL